MASVFLLQHSHEIDEAEEIKIIGIYSTRNKAEHVVEKYKNIQGFNDYPDGFFIDEYKIDEDNWEEGFIRV